MISLIIPTFGNFPRVRKLLSTIQRYERGNYEVIVVNDDPNVKSSGISKNIRGIDNDKNLGFARSVNVGMQEATGDILTLVNDDIVWVSPVLAKVEAEFKKDAELGVLGALLKYPRAGIQHGGMVFDPMHRSFYHIKKNPKTCYMLAVTGAFFAINRALYEKVGGLTDKFFLACEDTSYCLGAWSAGFKVKFCKEIQAIHEEGATRGRTIREKNQHKEWTEKEHEGINRFKASIDTVKISLIQKRIRALNGEGPMKIEVGSGFNPHPGYKHLDIRAGLPQLDYVCDFTQERLPFEDKSVEEILANHVIEHISFRKLPFVLGEWARVLEDGGKLVLRTPNLRFICESYLAGKITPEWPGDEKYIKDNLSDEITPAWWTNIKLFSGQDYAANFHHVCFDFEMLSKLLKRFGFGKVTLAKFDREFSPGELQIEALKGYQASIKESLQRIEDDYEKNPYKWKSFNDLEAAKGRDEVRQAMEAVSPPKKSCLVIRDGAMGDVILTTPIIERLSKEYGVIHVCTKAFEVFDNNPHVKSTFSPTSASKYLWTYDRTIDLNNAYELNPRIHIVEAYSLVAFGDIDTPLKTYLYNKTVPQKNYIVVHAAKSWENRTWSKEKWEELITHLELAGEKVFHIGQGDDYRWPVPTNLVGQESFWQMVDTIASAKLFIGMDSGPLHVAEAVGTPAIGIYTCANALSRSTSGSTYIVSPDIDCYGCLHDEKPPVHYCGCRRGDFKCLQIITPEKVLEKYEQFKRTTARGNIVIQDSNAA